MCERKKNQIPRSCSKLKKNHILLPINKGIAGDLLVKSIFSSTINDVLLVCVKLKMTYLWGGRSKTKMKNRGGENRRVSWALVL